MAEDTEQAIEVDDDSILAHKSIRIRPLQQMKQKHLRSLRRVVKLGQHLDPANLNPDQVFELMDALSGALEGLLIGWTPAEIDELSLEEMLTIYQGIGDTTRHALPNGISWNSMPRSAPTTRARGQTGSTQSS